MNPLLQQAVEVVFTSYLVPVFLLPVLWIASAVLARRGTTIRADALGAMRRMMVGYLVVAALVSAAWVLGRWLPPPDAARGVLVPIAWTGFAALNLLFAGLAIGMTSHFAGFPEGPEKDSVFLRFLGVVLLQPLGTAAALALLARLLPPGVHMTFPGFETITGVGI